MFGTLRYCRAATCPHKRAGKHLRASSPVPSSLCELAASPMACGFAYGFVVTSRRHKSSRRVSIAHTKKLELYFGYFALLGGFDFEEVFFHEVEHACEHVVGKLHYRDVVN